MAAEFMNETVHNKERTRERTAIYLGRLRDFGLGNPEGIPSELADKSDEELREYGERLLDQLVEPTDLEAFHCIDGREYLENADGSAPETRLRHLSGTQSNLGIALNGEAPVVDTVNSEEPIAEQAATIDEAVADTIGVKASGHLGGCGGANGEVDDQKAIHEKSGIMTATKTFMTHPNVKRALVQGHEQDFPDDKEVFTDQIGDRVRDRAGVTAEYLEAKGWSGQAVVDSAEKRNPRGVVRLKVGHDKYHGHKEPGAAIVIGDKTLPRDSPLFVANLKATKMVAEGLVGNRGAEGYSQLVTADIAKLFATCDRLPSPDAPLFLLVDAEY